MKIYIPSIVQDLKLFYGELLYDIASFPNIPAHLAALAKYMYKGVKQKQPVIFTEISNYHKDYLGKKDTINPATFTLADCQQTIANEYGFPNWESVEQLGNLQYDFQFERAVNLLLAGDLDALQQLITSFPYLLTATSLYGHQATLLHYAGSNGVEFWRQQVPMNLPAITSYLLEAGADKNATMKVYGGDFDTYALLVSSAHPKAAGILEEMELMLNRRFR